VQALLGRSYRLPVLILARAVAQTSFPSSVNDTLTILDSPAGSAVTYTSRTLFISKTAQQYASQLMGSAPTQLVYYAPAAVVSGPAAAGDSLSISDTVARGSLGFTRAVNDSLTISDSPARISTLPRSAADSLSISDAAPRGLSTPRAVGDTLTISDSPSGSAITGTQPERTLFISAAANRQATTMYSVVYPITLYYAPATVTSQSALVDDSLTISDSVVTTASTRTRAAADTVTISDSPAGSVVGGAQGKRTMLLMFRAAHQQAVTLMSQPSLPTVMYAPTAITVSPGIIGDTLTITDSVSAVVVSANQQRRGPWVWSEATNRAQFLMSQVNNPFIMYAVILTDDEDRQVNDSLTISDSLVRSGGIRTRTLADSLTITDSPVKVAVHPRAVNDTLSITDSPAVQAGNARAVNDSLTISDTLGRTGGVRTRVTADSLTITDGSVGVTSHPRSANDSLTIVDAIVNSAMAKPRGVNDTLTILDSTFVSGNPARAVADSLTITDMVTRVIIRVRSVADFLTISDSTTGMIVEAPYFDSDWEVALVGYESTLRSTLSDSYVYADVTSENDLRADVVEMAFTEPAESPVSSDWKTADWATGSTAVTATARVQVTEAELEPGRYMVWVRVTHPPIRPVLRCGLVRIF